MRTRLAPRRIDADFEEDPRYAVADREALWGVGYWVFFTVVITGIAWVMGGGKKAAELDFILGFPAWFFWSCLVATTLLALLPPLLVCRYFTDLPLGATGAQDDEETR